GGGDATAVGRYRRGAVGRRGCRACPVAQMTGGLIRQGAHPNVVGSSAFLMNQIERSEYVIERWSLKSSGQPSWSVMFLTVAPGPAGKKVERYGVVTSSNFVAIVV